MLLRILLTLFWRKFMRNLIFLVFILAPAVAFTQELNCLVTIKVGPKVQTTDQVVFKDMKNNFQQFMNTRKWTSDTYKNYEKINCSMLVNITEMPSIGNFTASVQVQVARPVFNTNYTTLIFNFADRDWDFDYLESMPLEYNDNTFTTNLTSMLAFYAYVILGFDYDSFSELGGAPHFQKALAIVNNAQQANRPGWQSIERNNRNRYWVIENVNNPQMTDLRKSMYAYHRIALDNFSKEPEKSRQTILQCLKDIKKVRDINPNAILVIGFFDAKAKELANIFSEGDVQVRREAYDLMISMDPSNKSNYDKVIAN
jgi:hypothetical protein